MVAVAQRLRRQVVALKIEGSIPSSHPKPFKQGNSQFSNTANQSFPILLHFYYFPLIIPPAVPKYFVAVNRPDAVIDFAPPELREKRDRNI